MLLWSDVSEGGGWREWSDRIDEAIIDLLTAPSHLEALTGTQLLITLSIAALCGLIVFLVYRYFNMGVVYSANFNILLVMASTITAMIVITLGSNLVLTLGMVGALSIVRFRAAVKDPLDVGFLFWSVAAGLTVGARLHMVALLGTAFIALVYILMTFTRKGKKSYLLIIRFDPKIDDEVTEMLKPLSTRLKNKTTSKEYCELTTEVKVRNGDVSFTQPMREKEGVEAVTIVEYSGDYT